MTDAILGIASEAHLERKGKENVKVACYLNPPILSGGNPYLSGRPLLLDISLAELDHMTTQKSKGILRK